MNIGILGAGSFGEVHIKVLKNIKAFNIQGFHDPNKGKSKKIADKYNIKYYHNPDQLIKECDAIDIVSKTSSHYEILKKVIKHNKHVFIEKPICCKKEEVENIIKKTQQYKPTIQIGHIERYNPTITAGLLDLKSIKSIYAKRTGSLNERNQNTSITLDLMIHDIDLIMSIVQSKIIKVKAISKVESNILNNHIECVLMFENGITAKLIASRQYNMKNERIIKICSDEETLELDLLNKVQKIIQKNNVQILEHNQECNPLQDELMAFHTSITKGTKPIVGVTEACAAVNIAIQIDDIINNAK